MKLSIIILNYNTSELTNNCVESIYKNAPDFEFEVIVVDNGSTDKFPANSKFKLVENKENLGFAKGNNAARKFAKGEYVLFLNSDTVVHENTLQETVDYLENNPEVGAVTCKIVLPDGNLDKDARRSFPTPWVAFTHFSGLDKIFSKSKIFAKYWYGYLSPDKTHEVDVLQGAYFLTRKKILDEVDWFSEEYFLDGEDIDLSWKIKAKDYKIIYYPKVSITHIKKGTKKKYNFSKRGVEAMEIFYKKFLRQRYNFVINFLVLLGIKILKIIR